MRRIPFTSAILALLFTSCAPEREPESNQLAMRTKSLNTELGYLKHEQGNQDVELRLLEGKIEAQEAILDHLREQLVDQQRTSKNLVTNKLAAIETKLAQVESAQGSLFEDVRQIKTHSNDLSVTIQQYRSKLVEFEEVVNKQNRNIANLETALNALTAIMEQKSRGGYSSTSSKSAQIYVVKSGDSLEKIAKANGLTVDQLKRINNLTKDLIVIGQELKLSSE